MRQSIFITFFIIFISLTLNAQNRATNSSVIATAGSKQITVDEFNRKYNEVREQTINPPTKQQFLEDLIRYEIGLQEAEKRNLNRDPIVQERIRQELYKALLEKELGERVQKIQVTDNEMAAWYRRNPEIRTSHILIEFKPGSSPEQVASARKRANEILAEVRKSKRPFEELVKLYSDDPLSKQAGGDVGWQSRITLMPSYYEATTSMKIGELKGIIETPFGFHIIKLTGRRSFEEANKRQIRSAVFDEKRKVLFDQYFENLKKRYPVKINQSLIQ